MFLAYKYIQKHHPGCEDSRCRGLQRSNFGRFKIKQRCHFPFVQILKLPNPNAKCVPRCSVAARLQFNLVSCTTRLVVQDTSL